MSLEIEAKLFLEDRSAIENLLAETQCVVTKPRIHERNQLFLSPYQDFISDKIVLRIRQDTQTRITYKAPAENDIEGLQTRLELETVVQDFDQMHAILRALGYYEGLFYEKYRTTYRHQAFNVEIVIDEMPFGDFIEIEGTPDDIEAMLERLNLQDRHRIKTNYVGIFMAIKDHYQLDFDDIRFDLFANVEIDTGLFSNL